MTDFDFLARLDRLRTLGQQRDLDAVAVVPGANMVYFTGLHFHLSERPTIALVLSGGGTAFIVPDLEFSKVEPHLEALDVRHVFRWTDADGYTGAFEAAAEALGLRGGVLGVDGMTMRVFEWLAFSAAAPGLHVSGMGQDLLYLRAVKTPPEVDRVRQAVALSEQSLAETLQQVQPGMTERQIREILNGRLSANGSHGHAFDPLVLVGANSALPHGVTGDNELGANDLLLFDFGGMIDGYPADITRTVCLGTPSDDIQKIHDTVREANAAARAAAKSGITAGAVDKAARDVIEAAGYGEYFVHRTGHGLGLDVHELPNINSGDETPLVTGMVFTIEPGIYMPGVGGVRIEDDVVITEDGCESLTTFSRGIALE